MLRIIQFSVLLSGLLFFSGSSGYSTDTRNLKFYHTHTGDSVDVTYYLNGAYNPHAMEDLKVFLADWRDAQQQEIDPQLLDILWQVQQKTGNDDVFEVISAYRSSQTNEMLRQNSTGVAKTSQHVLGKAIDVRLRGLDTTTLRDTARELGLGGVGYYASSNFVHIDSGRPRTW